MIQMDKVLSSSQKIAFSNKTLVLKTFEFKGFGSFRCGAVASKISQLFQIHHDHEIVTWPILQAVKTFYYCPNGHQRDAVSPHLFFMTHLKWCGVLVANGPTATSGGHVCATCYGRIASFIDRSPLLKVTIRLPMSSAVLIERPLLVVLLRGSMPLSLTAQAVLS